MKKIFFALIVLVATALAASYIFIPSKIKIKAAAEGSMNFIAASRHLTNTDTWNKWWPGPKEFYYNRAGFRLDKIKLNTFELEMFYKTDSLKNLVQLVPLADNNSGFTWECELESSKNPFTRWMQYFNARGIKKIVNALTDSLRNYMDKPENVYGFSVKEIKVTDSVLISTRSTFDHYPDEKEVDNMIQLLRKYISSQKAVEKNYPMLNVHFNGTNKYETMVAIATERLLPAIGNFSPKLVLKGGNVLEAEFTGGPAGIKKAFEEFENYRLENGFSSPAIPYQLLITDRLKENDTTKWITKIYYPVF
jgi:hypothetical protein